MAVTVAVDGKACSNDVVMAIVIDTKVLNGATYATDVATSLLDVKQVGMVCVF